MKIKSTDKYLNFVYKYFAVIIIPILVLLSLNKTSDTKVYNYHSPIYADGAGYYSYLISFFCADEIKNLPLDIDSKTGNAFRVNKIERVIETKYTSGSAILMAPFFLIGKSLNFIFNLQQPVFSNYFYFWIILAACFYCGIALYFINKIVFLLTENKSQALIVSMLLLLATNLIYYVINKPSYSHIYSFFLCACFVQLTIDIYKKPNAKIMLLFFLVYGLLIICRPTNFLFIIFPMLYSSKSGVIQFFKENKLTFFSGLIVFLLAVSPQLMYWYKISGHALFYSYTNERFSNWQHPQILYFLFSTVNGWFTYTPFMVLSFIGIIVMILSKNYKGISILVLLMVAIYTFSSWWIPSYGCSYGMRVMIELYPILIIPIAFLFKTLSLKNNRVLNFSIISFIAFCIYLNIDMIYYYDGCFYGGAWDWQAYLKLLEN